MAAGSIRKFASCEESMEAAYNPSNMQNQLTVVAAAVGVCLIAVVVAVPVAQQKGKPKFNTWRQYLGGSDSSQYSSLDQIDRKNVGQLQVAWTYSTGDMRTYRFNPIVVDGVMYTLAKNMAVVALDAATGKPVWSTLTVDAAKPYTITQAPRVIKGRVIIGNSGGEYGTRGYISAYDAETGKLAWRFFTVPGDPSKPFENAAMARAAKTWSGEWWKLGGGGPVWDSISYDPKLDLIYFGTGNGVQWARSARSAGKGDNLYLSSIIALHADTGEYAWHYQATPGEEWDFDA